MDDDELLRMAEETLTEIKVSQGLSERHASVLAAIRIRLTGSDGGSLEDLLQAAESRPPTSFEEAESQAQRKGGGPSLDDLLSQEPEKPEWPT